MKFVHVEVVADTHILGVAKKGGAFAPYHFQADEIGEWLGEVYPTLEAAQTAGIAEITKKIDFLNGWKSYSDGDTAPPCWVSAAFIDGWTFARADYERCADKEQQEELSDPAKRMAIDAAAKQAGIQMLEKAHKGRQERRSRF